MSVAMPAENRRVLVVDDEPGYRDMLRWWLEGRGFRVSTAADGAEAEELIARHRFSLVISDVAMPVKDGFSLLETLRSLDRRIPVILVTGFATVEGAVHAIKRGAADFLLKPFDMGALDARLEELMPAQVDGDEEDGHAE
jgi:DNA-binding NtrC family response regulator